jgi:hypothetical protein
METLDFFASFVTEAEFSTNMAEVYEKFLTALIDEVSLQQSENEQYDYAMVKPFMEVHIVQDTPLWIYRFMYSISTSHRQAPEQTLHSTSGQA